MPLHTTKVSQLGFVFIHCVYFVLLRAKRAFWSVQWHEFSIYHRVGITKSVDSIVESVDTISRDERDVP